MTTVYKDGRVTITMDKYGYLELRRSDGSKLPVSPQMDRLPDPVVVPQLQSDLLRKHGDDPANYDAYQMPGKDMYLVLPKAAAAPLLAARDDYRARLDAKRNDPATVERNRIHRLFNEADDLRGYPSDYYPALAKAKAALDAWRKQYPAAAAKEQADNLLAKADHQETLADQALVSAMMLMDRSPSRTRSAAEYRAVAAQLRQKADEILRNV